MELKVKVEKDVTEEELAYRYLLHCCYSLSLHDCNEKLKAEGFKPLTNK